MDLLQTVRKEGSRGGVDFKWDDVRSSQHRENYLGHSLMAPVGRWQKGKDLNWYAKAGDAEKTPEEIEAEEKQRRKDELRKVKEAEEDAMARALGLPVADRSANTEPLGERKLGSVDVQKALKEALDTSDREDNDRRAKKSRREDGRDRSHEQRRHRRDDYSKDQERHRRRRSHSHGRRHERRRRSRSRSRDRRDDRRHDTRDRSRSRDRRRYDDGSKIEEASRRQAHVRSRSREQRRRSVERSRSPYRPARHRRDSDHD